MSEDTVRTPGGRQSLGLLAITLVFVAVVGAIGAFITIAIRAGNDAAPNAAARHIDLGQRQANTGNFAGAIDEITKAISIDPESPEGYVARAEVLFRARDFDAAASDYTVAMEQSGISARLLAGRARAHEAAGNLDAAIADYDGMVELAPDSARTRLVRGRLLRLAGRFEPAVVDVVAAWELNRGLSGVDHELAWALWGVSDHESALEPFDRMVRRGPNNLHSRFGRGVTLYHLGDLEAAQNDLARAAATRGRGWDYAAYYLWLALARDEERDRAGEVLRAILAQRGGAPPDGWSPRIASFLLGELTEEEFLALVSPTNGGTPGQQCEAYFYAGSLRRLDGDHETAEAYFSAALATQVRNYYEYYSANAELEVGPDL
jgi:lipoprotein NlpI